MTNCGIMTTYGTMTTYGIADHEALLLSFKKKQAHH